MNKTSARFVCVLIALFMLFFCAIGAQAVSQNPFIYNASSSASPCAEDVCLLISAADIRLAIIPSGVHLLVPAPCADWFSPCLPDITEMPSSGQMAWLSESRFRHQTYAIQSYICHPHQGPPFHCAL
jgi:hypothetical protein